MCLLWFICCGKFLLVFLMVLGCCFCMLNEWLWCFYVYVCGGSVVWFCEIFVNDVELWMKIWYLGWMRYLL